MGSVPARPLEALESKVPPAEVEYHPSMGSAASGGTGIKSAPGRGRISPLDGVCGLRWHWNQKCPRQRSNITPRWGLRPQVALESKVPPAEVEYHPSMGSAASSGTGIKSAPGRGRISPLDGVCGLWWHWNQKCPRQNSNLQPFAPQANALSN